jgi:hypothetical protein
VEAVLVAAASAVVAVASVAAAPRAAGDTR